MVPERPRVSRANDPHRAVPPTQHLRTRTHLRDPLPPRKRQADPPRGQSVAVIGGGIAGLTAAYLLATAGRQVTLFEASDRFGGLGTYFTHEGATFDRFYHVIMPTDEHLLGLARQVGLGDDIYWADSTLGFLYDGRLHPLNAAVDLLRFGAVPFIDRVRLGFTAMWIGHVARPRRLDRITAAAWLRRLSGDRAFERLWKPLLQAKFGDAFDKIPALWYWSGFNRENGPEDNVKGYIRGGYRALALALIAGARNAGAVLLTNARVERVALSPAASDTREPAGSPDAGVTVRVDGRDHPFDQVVFCTPLPAVSHLADPASLGRHLTDLPLDLDHQGVINIVVHLRRSVSPYYWIPVVGCGVPFRGIVETSRVLDEDDARGRHLVYLLNYVHRDSAEYARSDDELMSAYVDGLFALFPDLLRSEVLSTHIFRTPFVEPIWTVGYAGRVPPTELVPERVYLATTAQAYPNVTSWNSAIGTATTAARSILDAGEADEGRAAIRQGRLHSSSA